LSAGLAVTVAELFKNRLVVFSPFFNPETGYYDIELGLSKPCKLRKDGRCSLYACRPLNCRMFPYWLLATGQDFDMFCFSGTKPSKAARARYKRYTKALGAVLMSEAKVTDSTLSRLKAWHGISDISYGVPDRVNESKRLVEIFKLINSLPLDGLTFDIITEIEKREFIGCTGLDKFEGWLQ